MKFLVHRAQFAVGDAGVDLGGGGVAVAEKELDGPEIGAVAKQVSGETVAQGMRRDVFNDAGLGGVEFDNALDTARGQATAFLIHKQRLA